MMIINNAEPSNSARQKKVVVPALKFNGIGQDVESQHQAGGSALQDNSTKKVNRNFSRTSILKKGIISQRQATDRSARRNVTMNLESNKDLLGGSNRSN
mmetsp:Transcript_14529/g.22552  ORF Transcript_14529/g.22552 Transcript_14529/m.22552 type:complete len:99 (+) Transcript_14529:1174-1470(+)